MSPALQAMQRDDAQNPAWLWVQDGNKRFQDTCAGCHTAEKMRGTAARYPAWDAQAGKPVTLAARIDLCRERHMKQPALGADNDESLALQSYLGSLSRGLPVAPHADARMAAVRTEGERLYRQRFGQLDFSCAQCHDGAAGGRLAGSMIPQGHPTGYPIYRLEWQGMGSLQRRLRNCMSGVRAEPFATGSAEFTAIEAYLMQRAAGMAFEAPAVRP